MWQFETADATHSLAYSGSSYDLRMAFIKTKILKMNPKANIVSWSGHVTQRFSSIFTDTYKYDTIC